MQNKTTRAFRTISEAGEELGLQPHVLRFWESKFSDIKPIKRGGGRRFYRPEDIEFLRGIKILLHEEKHPIKDVQKLIRLKGANSVVALGRSVEKAANPKDVRDTVLIPERIKNTDTPPISETQNKIEAEPAAEPQKPVLRSTNSLGDFRATVVPASNYNKPSPPKPRVVANNPEELEKALERLLALKSRWDRFIAD